MTKSFFRTSLALSFCMIFSACAVHYKNVPNTSIASPNYAAEQTVYFKIFERPVVSTDGPKTIEKTLKAHPFFENAIQIYDNEIPSDGLFVEINPKYQSPSFPALVFGYLSLSTLTILPAWSNDDGFDLVFTVYQEGKLSQSYRYESRRFLATWAGLLPFIWVNLLTEDESTAFESITKQFLNDAQAKLTASE